VLKAFGPLASCLFHHKRHRDRTRSCVLKALGPLAVAPGHIRALGTARADRGPGGDYTSASGPRPFSPPGKHSCTGRFDGEGCTGSTLKIGSADSTWNGRPLDATHRSPADREGEACEARAPRSERLRRERAVRRARISRLVRESGALSSSRKSLISGDSDRERGEGFHLTTMSAVTVLSGVEPTASERGEGFQLTTMSAVAVLSAVTLPRSERPHRFSPPGPYYPEPHHPTQSHARAER